MTDQEAAELFHHVLVRLRELEATDLVDDIGITVGRGALRSEGGSKADGALQTRLAPNEALVVALRMLVAAVEPPLHQADAERALETTISWRFDEVEPLEHEAGSLLFLEPPSVSREPPKLPSLTKNELETLRSRAAELLELTRETEKEGEDANTR